MDQANQGPPYKVEETAEKLGLSEQIVRDAAREGRLPAFRVGRQWLFPREKIDRMLNGEAA